MNNENNSSLPAAIESMISSLNSTSRDRHLRETHCALMERCIKAMQDAVNEYKAQRYFRGK